VLVRGPGYVGSDWVVVLIDVPGNASVMPLVVLMVILCVIAAMHKGAPYVLVWCRVRVPDPVYLYPSEGVPGSIRSRWAARLSCLRRTCSSCSALASILWNFVGFDKHVGALYSGQRAPLTAFFTEARVLCCPWRAARAAVPTSTERLVSEVELAEMYDLQASVLHSDSHPAPALNAGALASSAHDNGDGRHLSEDSRRLIPLSSNSEPPTPTQTPAAASESSPSELRLRSERLRSIDALRGACLCFMMLFNAGGCGYWFLEHR